MEKSPITELIALWPSRRAFAQDVGADVEAVHKWAQRGRIPIGFQLATVRAAQARGHSHVTTDWILWAQEDRDRPAPEAAE